MVLRRLSKDALLNAIRFDDIRRVNLASFPHGVFYFVEEDRVVVLGVLHVSLSALVSFAPIGGEGQVEGAIPSTISRPFCAAPVIHHVFRGKRESRAARSFD